MIDIGLILLGAELLDDIVALQFQLLKLGLLLHSGLFGGVSKALRPVCVRVNVLARDVLGSRRLLSRLMMPKLRLLVLPENRRRVLLVVLLVPG